MYHFDKLKTENLALIIIDMQDSFLKTKEKLELIEKQIPVIKFCMMKNIPIAIFEYDGEDTNILIKESLLNYTYKKTFIKHTDDAFYVRYFNIWLEINKINTILLMGVNACCCVYDTAKSITKNGFNLITIGDLIAGYCPDCLEPTKSWYAENGVYFESLKNI